MSSQAPWSDLASAAYCDDESYLEVDCATVDGVQLPTFVSVYFADLAGALPPSLGDLGPSLTVLFLPAKAIISVPAEIAALTGLRNEVR